MIITVAYSVLPGLPNSVPQPLVFVKFVANKRVSETYALVDSGAAGAVISTVIAEDLGIDWQKIPPSRGLSVGGNFIAHPAKIKAVVFDEEFMLTVSIIAWKER